MMLFQPRALTAQDKESAPDVLNMSLEDLMNVEIDTVYGASKYKQKLGEAPASITIVTGDDIRRYGYRTLADILRLVPGFYITYDRNYTYLGVRGFGRPGDYNSRVLLLVDGHRENDNIYDSALIGTEFPVDVDLIDRVEVIRGPNSSLYVPSAFLAVINVITKSAPEQKDFTASGQVGSYGTYKSRLTYGHQFSNGLDLLVSGTYYTSDGESRLYFSQFNSPATNNGIAENSDYDEARQVYATLSHGNLHLDGVYGWREKGVPTASYGTIFDDGREQTVDARGWLDLSYDRKFGSNWGITSRLYYDNYHYDGIYPYAGSDASATVLNKDVSIGQWWGAEFALSKRLAHNQTLILGSEYRDNFQQYQTNFDEQPYFSYFNSNAHINLWGIYAQDEIRLRSDLTLDVGLRHDHYSTFGGTTNPRAALIYHPFETTSIKLLYGHAFRAPNAYELYYAGLGYETNPQLRPETVRTTELVLEQYLQKDLRFQISGYYYPVRGLISQETDPANGDIVYRNNEQVNMKGVEISLRRQSSSGMEVGGSLSVQNAYQLGSPRTPLTNSPHTLGQANVSMPLFKRKLFASMALDCLSRRLTTAGNFVGGYALPDFTLFSQYFRHWEVSASLYNAFNQHYADPAAIGDPENSIIQDGRTFRLAIVYHF